MESSSALLSGIIPGLPLDKSLSLLLSFKLLLTKNSLFSLDAEIGGSIDPGLDCVTLEEVCYESLRSFGIVFFYN